MLLITHNSLTTGVDVTYFSKALQWRGYYLYVEQRVSGSHTGISLLFGLCPFCDYQTHVNLSKRANWATVIWQKQTDF